MHRTRTGWSTARDREALLLRMLQEERQRYDRLLEAPKPIPEAQAAAHPADPPPLGGVTGYRGMMRQRVLHALQGRPQGATRTQIERAVGVAAPLTDVLSGMVRDGLLVRPARGVYQAAEDTR